MSKFFNVVSNKNNDNNNNNFNNQNGNRVQGYITPSNNQNNGSAPDTFVYGSYASNNMSNPSMGQNNMNNRYTNQGYMNNQNMPQQGMNQQFPNMAQQAMNQQLPNMVRPAANQSPQKTIQPSINGGVSSDNEVLDISIEEQVPSTEALDPLNNANNPIPVNPVAPQKEEFLEEDLPKDVKANIFSVIGMMLGMILTPGTTIVNNSKKYRSTFKAMMITFWITVVSLALCIGTRILLGAFTKSYSAVTGATHISLNFANIFTAENYLQYLVIAFLISFVGIMIVSLVYYASSFLNSKGVPLGSYVMVSNLAMLPLIIGTVAIAPAISIISSYLSILVFIFCFLYTLIAFLIGINEVLTFKNINRKILYNVLNLSCIMLISIVLYVLMLRLNILVLPDLVL